MNSYKEKGIAIKILSIMALFLFAIAFVGGSLAYRNARTDSVSMSGTTSVLGASVQRSQLVQEITGVQRVGSLVYISLKVNNNSNDRVEFSPGLQISAITKAGLELPIDRLAESDPLYGGPLEARQSTSGSVVFSAQDYSVSFVRVYDGVNKERFSDVAVSVQ